MDDHENTSADLPGIPVPTPFPPGRIATCPLCASDLTPRTVHYYRGLAICLDCRTHAYPAALSRYVRAYVRHAPPSDRMTFRGLDFYAPASPPCPHLLPSWIQTLPKSVQKWVLSTPLLNPDWIARDMRFADVRRELAIGAICRDLADQYGRPVGGHNPRFQPSPISDQADNLRRQVQQVLGFD